MQCNVQVEMFSWQQYPCAHTHAHTHTHTHTGEGHFFRALSESEPQLRKSSQNLKNS